MAASFGPTGAGAASVLVAVGVAIVAMGLGALGHEFTWNPPSSTAVSAAPSAPEAPSVVYLNLTIAVDPTNGRGEFVPSVFSIPHSTRIVLTITNLDAHLHPGAGKAGGVLGTLWSAAVVTYGHAVHGAKFTWIGNSQLSHTFTLGPVGPGYGLSSPVVLLNVPVPVAPSNSTPSVVHTSFMIDQPGTYEWWCQTRCNPISMATDGYMQGPVTVT